MKRAILVALGTGALISSVAAIGIAIAGYDTPAGLNREGYDAAVSTARAERNGRLAACDALRASERETCRLVADSVSAARSTQIEEAFHRTRSTARASQRARIDARYQVQRAECQSLGGFKRDKCLVSAHAERGRSLLEVAAPYLDHHAAN